MTGSVGCISLLIDIGMLTVGVWVLVKGSLPARLLRTLLGNGQYSTSPRTARLFGALLVAPLAGLVLAVVSTQAANELVSIIFSAAHLIALVVVILTALVWARQIGTTTKASE